MMRTINKLKNEKVETLNKTDVEMIFGSADHQLKEELEYLDCKVVKVADLFNVTLPAKKFTREELNHMKFVETMYC
jgi:hypothetical protein